MDILYHAEQTSEIARASGRRGGIRVKGANGNRMHTMRRGVMGRGIRRRAQFHNSGKWIWAMMMMASITLYGAAWKELADRRVSPAAKRILHVQSSNWTHAQGSCIIAHGHDAAACRQAVDLAEFAAGIEAEKLGIPLWRGYRHLYILGDEEWDELNAFAGWRNDGLAAHYRGEIYVRKTAVARDQYRMDIPHEIAHMLLADYNLALFIEEGFAECLGWDATRQFYANRGKELIRPARTTALAPTPPWNQWFGLTAYPESEARDQAFYQQAEQWAHDLLEHATPGQLNRLLKALYGVHDQPGLERALENAGLKPAD